MPDLPPNVRRLLAEKYPPAPRVFRELEDAMSRAAPAMARLMQQMVDSFNRANRQANTCRLCGRGHTRHHSGCPLERP